MQVEIYNVSEINGTTQEQKLDFALFTREQAGVYGAICPNKDSIEPEKIIDYPLPDRVLEIVKLVQVDNRFYKYEVWKSDAYEIKDPILLGRVRDEKNPTYTWNDKFYLIARWGEELEQFDKLKTKAINFMKEHSLTKCIKLKAMLSAYLENPDLFCKVAIENGNSQIAVPHFEI